jgi:hypothetical protein
VDQGQAARVGREQLDQPVGITMTGHTLWADGTYVDPVTGNNDTLLLQGNGNTWTVVDAPNPGTGSNILGGITAVDGQLWAAGIYDNGGSELPLIEHHPATQSGS